MKRFSTSVIAHAARAAPARSFAPARSAPAAASALRPRAAAASTSARKSPAAAARAAPSATAAAADPAGPPSGFASDAGAASAAAARTAAATAAAAADATDAADAADAPVLDDTMVESLEVFEAEPGVTVGYANWGSMFRGLNSAPFEQRITDILLAPVVASDVEITPDGLLYLPEIKYRRILNRAFGPGAWGIWPSSKTMVTRRQVTREYGLMCLGRLVSLSRGEMDFFSPENITTAMEGCKSNALMRCCKDLGIASELWDPAFIREFKAKFCESKYIEKKRRMAWKRKDRPWEYPYN